MTEIQFHELLVNIGFGLALLIFISLFFVTAPYGRHTRGGWGLLLDNRLGWILMESPSALGFAAYFFTGTVTRNLPILAFLLMYEIHYLNRAFIYPFTLRDGRRKMPLSVMLMGLVFNLGNSYTNGRYLFHFSGGYPDSWLADPRFIIGLALFITGLATNLWADHVLRNLRVPGDLAYHIPNRGLYRWISCPNYFGEIVEWTGWAIATWSLPGLAFAIWTIANLAPRARAHHAWYHARFPTYPPQRKALIPFLY